MGAMPDALYLIPGVLAAALGGEFFVRGTVGGATRARIAPGIIAATVAAFATSSPELSVAINSATAGSPEIALGDVLGSNVANVGFVLAIAILFGGLTARREDMRRDVPVALGAPVVIFALGRDGVIDRADAVVLLALFASWLTWAVVQASRERSARAADPEARSMTQVLRDGAVGLGLLILAGRLIVWAAADFGRLLGWDTFTVGAVLVAVATSAPELATVVAARVRGHDDVSVGTVLGSNIFNGLLIIGVAAAIHPIMVPRAESTVAIGFGLLTILMLFPGRSGRLPASRGILLLATFAAYLWTAVAVHAGAG